MRLRSLLVGCTVLASLALSAADGSAQGTPNIPPQVLQSWRYFIGEWEVSGKVGNVAVTGGAAFDWSAGRHSFFCEQIWLLGKEEKPLELTSLSGWDAKMQRTVETGFSSAGGYATLRYATNLTNPGAKQTLGQAEGVGAGDARPWTGQVTLDRISANQFQLMTVVDGNIVHQLTYRRVPAPKQPVKPTR